jgi:type IV pilus assembly protein PilO
MALLPTKQRDQILLIVIVLALGAIGGYFMYLYEDKATAIASLETHVQALDSLNDKVKSDVKRGTFDKARREAAQYEKELVVLSQLVPSTNEVPTLLDQVSTAARRAGLELQDVAPGGPQPGEDFDTYKYKLAVIGGFHPVAQFLTNIATLERIVAPMNVEVHVLATPKGEKRARAGEALLEAKFDIQTYVAHGGNRPVIVLKPTTQGNP